MKSTPMKKLITTGWIATAVLILIVLMFPEPDPRDNDVLMCVVMMGIITWVYKNYNNPRYFE